MGLVSYVIPEKELKGFLSREEVLERKRIVRTIFCDRSSLAARTVKLLRQCRRPRFNLGREDNAGEGNGNPLQHCCLENPMDRGAWGAAVHGVAKRQTKLSY